MRTGCTEVAESLPVTFHAVKSQTDNYNLYTSWPQKPAFPTESGWVTYTTNTSNWKWYRASGKTQRDTTQVKVQTTKTAGEDVF